MSRTAQRSPERGRFWLERIPAGPVSALEFLLLGLAAAFLVLLAFPSLFTIESSCVGAHGVQSTAGDTYIEGFVVAGTLGWLGVLIGTICASIADRRNIVLLLPLLWFLTLVLAARFAYQRGEALDQCPGRLAGEIAE